MLDSLSNCLPLLEICPKCCLIAIFQVNSLFLDMMESTHVQCILHIPTDYMLYFSILASQ